MDVVVLVMDSDNGAATPLEITDIMNTSSDILKRECNVRLNIRDTKFYGKETPKQLTSVHTDKAFDDKGNVDFFLGDAYSAAAYTILTDFMHLNPQTVSGIKAPAFIIFTTVLDADGVMHNVWSNNFVFVDDRPGPATVAHELGHLCGHIWHVGNAQNLMTSSATNHVNQFLNWFQRTTIRSSKYVSFI